MTHEEKAREILSGWTCDTGGIFADLTKEIAEALASAEKKGWNEAIEAARKLVDDQWFMSAKTVSDAVNKLKRG